MGYDYGDSESRWNWSDYLADPNSDRYPTKAVCDAANLQASKKDGEMSTDVPYDSRTWGSANAVPAKPIIPFNWGLPTDPAARKQHPVVTGCLDYFPAAIAGVAFVSWVGNQKHNPGQPLHWARGKSVDQEDCIGRHTLERGDFEYIETADAIYAVPHSLCRAWRALAAAQLDAEANGAPVARGAK